MSSVKAVLLDVEGTTTSIGFVHDVLFPYSARNLEGWVAQHSSEEKVRACLDQVRASVEGGATGSDAPVIEVLRRWIAEDRKHPALKRLQGFMWRDAYESGAFRGHVYDEVPGCLRRWKQAGLALAVYSSGSVEAQKLLFTYSTGGDLTPLFSAYFDTAVGAKREPAAYARIADELRVPRGELVFLSDVEVELDAARASGLQTLQVVRPGTAPGAGHPVSSDFIDAEYRLGLASELR